MNQNEKIKAWLANPVNYNDGLMLYAEFGKNRNILHLLQRRVWMQKLLWELSKLATGKLNPGFMVKEKAGEKAKAEAEVKAEARAEAKPVAQAGVVDNPKGEPGKITILSGQIRYDDLTDGQKIVFDSIRETYKLMRAYHEKMKLAATEEERAALRADLVKGDDHVRKGWAKLDGMLENN